MTGFFRSVVLVLVCLPLALSGCGPKKSPGKPARTGAKMPVTCIKVLPVKPAIDYEGSLSSKNAADLSRGAVVMDNLLLKTLGTRSEVRFVTNEQLSDTDDHKSSQAMASAGNHSACNLVLETTLHRYRDRDGGQYSANAPASVAFEYSLTAVDSGETLCRSKYDETQSSVFENLFSWGKASSRGFTWVSAEGLLQEGLQDRFDNCPYLDGR